jgi:large subunit ribosomal protein L4
MAAPKAPLLDGTGKKAMEVTLAPEVFAIDVKPHLVHEVVRAEAAASRAGTQAAKSRGLVSGGRAKPWRQKGTGRARAGTIRAPQWTGGGVAFAPQPRSYDLKVNRKVRKSALRATLSAHAQRGSLGVINSSALDKPSTRAAARILDVWSPELPLVVVAQPDEERIVKSFRNLERVLVLEPSELEVGVLVWAHSVLASQAALERIQELAK